MLCCVFAFIVLKVVVLLSYLPQPCSDEHLTVVCICSCGLLQLIFIERIPILMFGSFVSILCDRHYSHSTVFLYPHNYHLLVRTVHLIYLFCRDFFP